MNSARLRVVNSLLWFHKQWKYFWNTLIWFLLGKMIVNKQNTGAAQSGSCSCPAKPYPHYHGDSQQQATAANTSGQPQAVPVEQIHYPRLGDPIQPATNAQPTPQARGASPLPPQDQRPGSSRNANGGFAPPSAGPGSNLNVEASGPSGGSSPSVRRKLTPAETLTECERESGELEAHIDSLAKSGLLTRDRRSNDYRASEERGMRIILRLDELDCSADARLRADRKRIVQLTQRVLEKLERYSSTAPAPSTS